MRRVGYSLLTLVIVAASCASWFAPNPPEQGFQMLLYAPPTPVYFSHDGHRGLHIHPLKSVSRLEQRFEEDASRPVTLRWLGPDGLVSAAPERGAPLLLLGADGYGRDIFSRLLHGARITLALAFVSTLAAVGIGVLVGGIAGYAGGWADEVLSRTSDLLLVLPTIYLALALRAFMPLALSPQAVFVLLASIFAVLGWPVVARGVRAIVAAEREREYVTAAHALGARPIRLVVRHLLPAARGHVAIQAALLLPAFILAESTLSYVGLGFPDATPSWGTLLQESARVALTGAPWLLAPAAAVFLVVLAVNLVVQGHHPVQLG